MTPRRAPGAAGRARSLPARSSYERIYAWCGASRAGASPATARSRERAGLGRSARQVGYALHALSDLADVPWHRVVNARGEISPRASGFDVPQRRLLAREGVRFDARGRIDLAEFGWRVAPRSRRRG